MLDFENEKRNVIYDTNIALNPELYVQKGITNFGEKTPSWVISYDHLGGTFRVSRLRGL
jgi:hypothetical protein